MTTERPRRSSGNRPQARPTNRTDRPRSDRPRTDRPRRGGNDFRDRPRRDDGNRAPRRFDGDKPRAYSNDRPRSSEGFRDRPQRDGERRPRPYGDRPRRDDDNRGPRRFDGDKPRAYSNDRPRSSESFRDRPQRDGENFRGRPKRDGERSARPYGDRPRRDDGERRPPRRFDDPTPRERKPREEGERSFDKKPFGKKFDKNAEKAVKPRTLRARRREISQPEPEAAEGEGLAFREAALNAVQAVLSENATLDLALAQYGKRLPERERRQAHALAAACIRYQQGLDAAIDARMKEPFEAVTVEKGLLRLGAAQILLLGGIPDHAAVSTTVLLAQQIERDRVSGLINAVLRGIVADKGKIRLQSSGEVPTWIREQLDADYGPKAEALMESLVGRAAMDFRLRDETLIAEVEGKGGLRLPFTRDGWRLPVDTRPEHVPGLFSGGAYVQDGAAQIPARLLAENLQIAGDVVDLCAAPGGKTVQLVDYLPKRKVIAVDAWADRLKLVEENLTLRGLKAELLEADGRSLPFADRSMAAVLVDAPCTATGTSRRHPEALHRKTPQELETLRRIQQQMLREAARLLKPGGILVYATCSLFKAEGEEQIANLLKNDSRFTRLPLPAEIKPFATKHGDVRVTPLDGVDGFFVSALRLG